MNVERVACKLVKTREKEDVSSLNQTLMKKVARSLSTKLDKSWTSTLDRLIEACFWAQTNK